jgi:transcriptional regulator with XRE-family HTH domain
VPREIKLHSILRQLIDGNGYSKNHAAVASGVHVSPSAVSQYLRGRTLPSLPTLVAIADFFETGLDHLVFGEQGSRSSPVEASVLVRYLERSLWELDGKGAARADLVGRIAQALASQIDSVARGIATGIDTLPGTVSDDEACLLEPHSTMTRIISINLQHDIVVDEDGTERPGRFLPIVLANLRAKHRYRFLLSRGGQPWGPFVGRYRHVLRQGGATEADLALCEFKETDMAIAVGYTIYELNHQSLREEHPVLLERLRHMMDERNLLGYVLPTSPDLVANPTMDKKHVQRAVDMFDQQWRSRRASAL